MPPPQSLPPIPLPTSLTTTTPSLPSTSQALLISHLRAQSALPDLQNLLSDSLARNGWTDRVRALALELLRNGTCETFPELIVEVMRRARLEKDKGQIPLDTQTQTQTQTQGTGVNGTSTPTGSQTQTQPQSQSQQNGTAAGANSAGAIPVSRDWTGGPDGLPDVRIPETTVEAGVEFLKEKIRDVVEVVDEDDDD